MYKMKKLLSLFALPIFLGALPANATPDRYEVTPHTYEGNYHVEISWDDGFNNSLLLDCPSGKYTFFDYDQNSYIIRSVYSPGKIDAELKRICLRRWGEPGIGRRS